MNQNITRVLSVISFYFCVSTGLLNVAFASQQLRAVCWEGNCLKYGWSITGIKISEAVENKCRDEDCAAHGWYGAQFAGEQFYTQCMQGACFKNGYWVIKAYTQKKLATVKCSGPVESPDCFKHGWEVITSNGRHKVNCMQNDCPHKGWWFNSVQTGYQQVKCSKGDCFKYGWEQISVR